MFKIETGIPIPNSMGGGRSKYPFKKFKIGESFYVHLSETNFPDIGRLQNNLTAAARHALGPRSVTTRIMDGGVRVWRIK